MPFTIKDTTYYYYNQSQKTIRPATIVSHVSDSEIHVKDEYVNRDEDSSVILSKEQLFENTQTALEHVRLTEKDTIENLLVYAGDDVADLLHFAMVQDANNLIVLEVIRRRCQALGIDTQKLMTYHFDF